jgi:peptide/nickel transport system substrate-binding protein
MTRNDSVVVGALVVLLAVTAGFIGAPALRPPANPGPSSTASEGPITARPYVEGTIGAAVSISPLTARSQVDRDLVALIFSGLVRNGPGGTLVPDLAKRWSVDAAGRVWTVELRDDARWHDGEPVTSDDVVYTIQTLQDPAYTGPSAGSWNEVTVQATSPTMVTFTLKTPLGGFLQALTQPIAPAHILGEVPVDLLPELPFGTAPIGSGPFALADLTATSATLVPSLMAESQAASPGPSASAASDSLTTPAPTIRPERPLPYLAGIEFRFFASPEPLAAAYRSGALDAVSGISPQLAAELGAEPGSRLLRFPGSTLTAILPNLRPSHPEFRSPGVRTALLEAIDRQRLVTDAYAGAAVAATGPIPASSPLHDPAAKTVAFDRTAARKALRAAAWTSAPDGWHLPKAKLPLKIDVLSPDEAANPGLYAAAEAVVRDWKRLGLGATHVALPPGEFVTSRLSRGDFQVAVADVAVGLDPDLYPLMASSQTLSGGSNVMGVQDPALDALLMKARAPGSEAARMAAYSALQKALAAAQYVLPLTFPDEVVVARDTLSGPAVRQVGDPSDRFWDVLTWRLAASR